MFGEYEYFCCLIQSLSLSADRFRENWLSLCFWKNGKF
jgi:hypothetical protein